MLPCLVRRSSERARRRAGTAARTLLANSASNVAVSSSAVGPNHENPPLFTSTSTSPASSARLGHVVSVSEIGRDEPGATTCVLDRLDHRRATFRVATVHDHVETVARELEGHRTTDAGGGSGDERHRWCCLRILDHNRTPSFRDGPSVESQ